MTTSSGGKKTEHHPVFTLQHSGQFHSLGTKNLNFECKMSEITFIASVWCHFESNLDTLAPTEPSPPCKKMVHGCSAEGGFVAWFREEQKEESTLGRSWISIQIPDILERRKDVKPKLASLYLKVVLWTLSKGGGETWFQSQPPETLQTLFSGTLIAPTKNSGLGPMEAVSGARYFLWNKQHCSASANRAGLSEGSSI